MLNATCLHLFSDLSFPSALHLLFHLGMRNRCSRPKTDSHLWEAIAWLMTFWSYWKFGDRTGLQLNPDMFTKLPKCLRLFARTGSQWRMKKTWPSATRGQRRGSVGTESWQRWRKAVPLRRWRKGPVWKRPVSWRCAYARNTDGCRALSGMCQEAWINSGVPEIMFMVHFFRSPCTINFTSHSVEWHSWLSRNMLRWINPSSNTGSMFSSFERKFQLCGSFPALLIHIYWILSNFASFSWILKTSREL